MKLEKIFGKMKIFMAHVYAGDHSLNFSKELILMLQQEGVDILELGIPFSDPIADGKVFQDACQRSLKNGTTPDEVLALAKSVRFEPTIITTYYNIILQKGLIPFVDQLKKCNVQGLIVPDLPFEESTELNICCKEKGLALIYIVAPTTFDERLDKILTVASGFLYVISVSGVTGTTKKSIEKLEAIVEKIKARSSIPVLVGFGIAKPEDVTQYQNIPVDGFIVGSQICREYTQDLHRVKSFLKNMRSVIQ